MRRAVMFGLAVALTAGATPVGAWAFEPRIAFVQHPAGAKYAPKVKAMDASGNQRVLEEGAYGVTWHPNGRRLAVVTRWSIVATKPDGTRRVRIARAGQDDSLGIGGWSPAATEFAYQRYDIHTGTSQIEVIDLATRKVRVLVEDDALNVRPLWTPDGSSIVFSRDTDGPTGMDVHVVDADGGAPAQLTVAPSDDIAAAISPDGDRILMTSDRSGSADLYLMPMAGEAAGGTERLTDWPGYEGTGEFSPAGTHIVFWASVAENEDLYLFDLESREAERLTSGPARQVSPAWRPGAD